MSGLAWPIVDHVLERRPEFIRILGLERYPYGTEFTAEYFDRLRERKAAVIAWAEGAGPTVTFIGQRHTDHTGAHDAAARAPYIQRVQDWSYDQLKVRAKDAQVITFEQYGSDERVTPRVMIRLLKEWCRTARWLHPGAPVPSNRQIDELFAKDRQASIRAIREFGLPPIYCGEEWPNALELFVLMRKKSLSLDKQLVVEELRRAFDRLRSEIILIRTLEFLQRREGQRGVILQGNLHGPHLTEVADEYHVNVSLVMPTDL
jgi:hypothetical protein